MFSDDENLSLLISIDKRLTLICRLKVERLNLSRVQVIPIFYKLWSVGAIQGEPGRRSSKFEHDGNVRARARLR